MHLMWPTITAIVPLAPADSFKLDSPDLGHHIVIGYGELLFSALKHVFVIIKAPTHTSICPQYVHLPCTSYERKL